MEILRTPLRCLAVACILGGAACAQSPLLPGFGPPQRTPRPVIPEPTCGNWNEREVTSPQPTFADGAIIGAADFHFHQFANRGFGGRILWGEPFHNDGIKSALSSCGTENCLDDREALALCSVCEVLYPGDEERRKTCRTACEGRKCSNPPPHGHFGAEDVIGMVLGQGHGHLVGGYPDFLGWPNYNTFTHQQAYHRWLRRAFDGGLRLVVMHAVTNETLCQVFGEIIGKDRPCDDMTNADAQLDGANKLEAYIDYQSDCIADNGGKHNPDGKAQDKNAWYRIARSPKEAREIIADGKLAVVLGLEVDELFNCRQELGGMSRCDEARVMSDIEKYYKLGVRHVFPVHVMDNGVGGAAAYKDFFNIGNLLVNGRLMDVDDCPGKDYEFKFGGMSTEVSAIMKFMAAKMNVPYRDDYKNTATHCNTRGLTPVGERVIKKLMGKRMIIDVDHMSARTRDDVLKLTKNYAGVVSGHAGFTDMVKGEKKAEGELTKAETTAIVARGGKLAPILDQASRDESIVDDEIARKIPGVNDCGRSAKSFAASYLYAVRHAKGSGVGFGSDMNGMAGLPAPRFGLFACGGDGAQQAHPVMYPIQLFGGLGPPMYESQAGNRVFDINVDGYAHAGMFPDFVAELRAIGLTDKDLEPLFRSAEAYISMWECAENEKSNECTVSSKRIVQ